MSVIKSFCMAFLMYSRIPMPQVEWNEENRRYALCFFPFIGVVIDGVLVLWYLFCNWTGINDLLYAACSVAVPVIITGGIHLDGFCDVCDAKACCGSQEKMLAVMSDSHIGAFAAINLVVYLFVQMGLFSQVDSLDILWICALGFVQSRAWSGLAAVTFKSAKREGALMDFSQPAHKTVTIMAELLYLMLTTVFMVYIDFSSGICGALGGVAAFIYYRRFAYKKFGGITGDLAGYFLEICELSIMAFALLANFML